MRFPNLLYLLGVARLSQYELARRVGISESRLSRCLRGRFEFTSIERARIVEVLTSLGISTDPAWIFLQPVPPRRPLSECAEFAAEPART